MNDKKKPEPFEEELARMSMIMFESKQAKIVALVGRVIGLAMISMGLLIGLLDHTFFLFNDKLTTPCIIVALGGFLVYYLLHKIAIRIDKRPK